GYEVIRRQITLMVEDVIQNSVQLIAEMKPNNIDDIHNANKKLVGFSDDMAKKEQQLKKFLFKNLYYHPVVLTRRDVAEQIVGDLFDCYHSAPQNLPYDWYQAALFFGEKQRAQLISDFLSGMTDNYALREYRRLFDRAPNLS
ncbi:MAG: deoxyguanosinetriphosphate triphosphohydrolase, partial [Bartonella sp.]|nr:deoxyguanosinetriphosphate triphosphohydrolase [Bartonella sp.]